MVEGLELIEKVLDLGGIDILRGGDNDVFDRWGDGVVGVVVFEGEVWRVEERVVVDEVGCGVGIVVIGFDGVVRGVGDLRVKG